MGVKRKPCQENERCWEMSRDVGRCLEMSGDLGRCREMSGDVGRCREMSSDSALVTANCLGLAPPQSLTSVPVFHMKAGCTCSYW